MEAGRLSGADEEGPGPLRLRSPSSAIDGSSVQTPAQKSLG